MIEDHRFERISQFKYLGSITTKDKDVKTEVHQRHNKLIKNIIDEKKS